MKAPFFKSALWIAGVSLLVSCQKEAPEFATQNDPVLQTQVDKDKKPKVFQFTATVDSRSFYIPDFENGATLENPYPGYSASIGEGVSSHSGRITSFASFYITLNPAGYLEAVTIPMEDSPYPFYEQLAPYFTPEEIQAMKDNQVHDIGFDKQGNSAWSANGWYKAVPIPGNPTRLSISGRKEFIGGTGNSTGARGPYTFYGYTDLVVPAPQSPTEPTNIDWIRVEGTITVDRK